MSPLRNAIVLSAGLGIRMRPITETIPKPLVEVGGLTLIDRALATLRVARCEKVVVNIHHLGDQMIRHLRPYDGWVVISDETDQLLDSAGAIVKALPELGSDPFCVLNADSFWIDSGQTSLERLALAWDGADMDILLMLSHLDSAIGHNGKADFVMDPHGRLARAHNRAVGLVYAGAAILHPRIFAGARAEPHSLNHYFDSAIEAGRLFGVAMSGCWFTVGTPEAVTEAESVLARLRPAS